MVGSPTWQFLHRDTSTQSSLILAYTVWTPVKPACWSLFLFLPLRSPNSLVDLCRANTGLLRPRLSPSVNVVHSHRLANRAAESLANPTPYNPISSVRSSRPPSLHPSCLPLPSSSTVQPSLPDATAPLAGPDIQKSRSPSRGATPPDCLEQPASWAPSPDHR